MTLGSSVLGTNGTLTVVTAPASGGGSTSPVAGNNAIFTTGAGTFVGNNAKFST